MATHSSILAWKIPWTEKPCRLQSTSHPESDITEHVCNLVHINHVLILTYPHFIIMNFCFQMKKKKWTKEIFIEHLTCIWVCSVWEVQCEWNKMTCTIWKTHKWCKPKNHKTAGWLQLTLPSKLEGLLEKEISRRRDSALLNSTIHNFFWGFKVGLDWWRQERGELLLLKSHPRMVGPTHTTLLLALTCNRHSLHI